jgi:ribosomal protein L11 methyltransferase
VTAYVPLGVSQVVLGELNGYLDRLRGVFPDALKPKLSTSPLKTENWAIAWQADFKPIEIGKGLLVTPPWIKPEPHGRNTIAIEPAEAFGTGTHETTQGCLELLEEAITELNEAMQGLTVLDIGCGSGILAIAAAKLGARNVRAVDNDPVAVESARKNLALNEVVEIVQLECLSAQDVKEPADIVVANLDTMTLRGNKSQLVNLAARYLIVSGVPIEEWENVKKEFLAERLFLKKEIRRADWSSGLFGRR